MRTEKIKSVEDVPYFEGDILKNTIENIVQTHEENSKRTRKTSRSIKYKLSKEEIKSLILKNLQSDLKKTGKVKFWCYTFFAFKNSKFLYTCFTEINFYIFL